MQEENYQKEKNEQKNLKKNYHNNYEVELDEDINSIIYYKPDIIKMLKKNNNNFNHNISNKKN